MSSTTDRQAKLFVLGLVVAMFAIGLDYEKIINIAAWLSSGAPALILLWAFYKIIMPLLSVLSLVEDIEGSGIGLGFGYIAGGLIIGDTLTAGLACVGIGIKVARELHIF